MIYKYNDYELLYLISEKNDDALEIMYHKYEPLIKKRIKDFKIKERCREDFFQEGLFALNTAINKYDQKYRKSFNKYFDLILQRRFMYLLKSEKDYYYNTVLIDNVELFNEAESNYYIAREEEHYYFSKFEREVFECLKLNMKAKDIAQTLNINVRKVYDAICRIKKKTKSIK